MRSPNVGNAYNARNVNNSGGLNNNNANNANAVAPDCENRVIQVAERPKQCAHTRSGHPLT